MDKQFINPPELAEPRGFNHGILVTGGRLLFLAGQDATGENGRIVGPGDLLLQYEEILRHFQLVVTQAGGQMTDIVKLNIFVKDRDGYVDKLRELGQIHRRYFGNYYPTMALFEINRFFQNEALIELEGMAVIP